MSSRRRAPIRYANERDADDVDLRDLRIGDHATSKQQFTVREDTIEDEIAQQENDEISLDKLGPMTLMRGANKDQLSAPFTEMTSGNDDEVFIGDMVIAWSDEPMIDWLGQTVIEDDDATDAMASDAEVEVEEPVLLSAIKVVEPDLPQIAAPKQPQKGVTHGKDFDVREDTRRQAFARHALFTPNQRH